MEGARLSLFVTHSMSHSEGLPIRDGKGPHTRKSKDITMTQKATLLIWIVLFLTSLALAAIGSCAAIGCDLLPTSIAHLIDGSPITMAIMVVFSVGLITNGINTMFILRQQALVSDGVRATHSRRRNRVSARGLLGLHIDRLYEMAGGHSMESVSQSTSLNAIRNQLFRRQWLVRSASSLLLTLGLVGTVLGLTKSWRSVDNCQRGRSGHAAID